MDKRPRKSIDGMLLKRREDSPLSSGQSSNDTGLPNRFIDQSRTTQPAEQALPQPTRLNRSEIDASLDSIDQAGAVQPRAKQPFRRPHRLALPKITKKRVVLALVLILLLFAGFFGYKIWNASSKVLGGGNIFDLLGGGEQLQTGQYGRSNILVFGTSRDDPGHSGAYLTDSMMVLSLDQDKKNAIMFSVPRDLWVKYDTACAAGYEGKVNALYQCYSNDGQRHEKGAAALRQKIGQVFGIDVQYSVAVDYTAVVDLVNAVGGIDITIDSPDPRGILDREFDRKCPNGPYTCYRVKYDNGPAHLNGKQALYLARARNAHTGYGLPRGNFDREANQRKILQAIRDKAISAGTLANPIKVSDILDALGDNIRTNFTAGETKTLIGLAQDIQDKDIRNISLVEPPHEVVTTGSVGAQSVVKPAAGLYDYSGIQNYIKGQFSFSPLTQENASIEVLNGGASSGAAGREADKLTEAGFVNVTTGDTPTEQTYQALQWYDLSDGSKSQTADKLSQALGQAASGSQLPKGVTSEADFVIILSDGAS
ncbi:MAG TPA: LCP family protein [Candidatus Saccharimonadales bacterium]|nr:LCP family protein [Candidatus Saccharimonadales bacterium]